MNYTVNKLSYTGSLSRYPRQCLYSDFSVSRCILSRLPASATTTTNQLLVAYEELFTPFSSIPLGYTISSIAFVSFRSRITCIIEAVDA